MNEVTILIAFVDPQRHYAVPKLNKKLIDIMLIIRWNLEFGLSSKSWLKLCEVDICVIWVDIYFYKMWYLNK